MNFFKPLIKQHLSEYLLLIEPHNDLTEKITTIKQYFFERYKTNEALRGKPHLTLAKFIQHSGCEERILQRLRTVAIAQKPFVVELMDFGSFPSHTIYINVLSRFPFSELVKSIKTAAQSLMKFDNDNRPHFITEPHITIARKLKPWQYEEGVKEFSHKNFSAKFIANSMVLLRKDFDGPKYALVERFSFLDICVTAKQSSLF